MFAPSMAGNSAFQEWWGRFERLGATPAACIEIMRLNSEIDTSPILPSIHVPTLVIHRTDDGAVNVEGGRELAALIPGARYVELPGSDHIPFIGDNSGEIVDAIEEFLTGSRTPVTPDRVLGSLYRHCWLDRESCHARRPPLARPLGRARQGDTN